MPFADLKVLKEIRHNGVVYKAGDIIYEINADSALNLAALKAAEIIPKQEKTDDDDKEKTGNPDTLSNNTSEKTAPVYAELTNAQQIEYLSTLSDDEFINKLNDEFIETSKSKAKAYIHRREKFIKSEKKENS